MLKTNLHKRNYFMAKTEYNGIKENTNDVKENMNGVKIFLNFTPHEGAKTIEQKFIPRNAYGAR